MNYSQILNQIAILFLIMFVGFIAGKTKIISKEVNFGLSKILINITLPFMIIDSFHFQYSKEMLLNAGILLIISLLIHSALSIVSLIMYRKYDDSLRKILRFVTIFSNCGFIGYPVVGSVYGSEGIFYTAIYNVGFNLFVWTVGVTIFSKSKGRELYRKAILNPGIISVFIGIILFIFSVELPYAIGETIRCIGSMTTPLSMMIVGVSLCETNLKEAFIGVKFYYLSFVRLILTPIIVMIVLKSIGLYGLYLGVPVLVSAMPAAANTVTFAQIYEGNVIDASKATVVTTILSAITIPMIIYLL